jgi:anaerobic magnesium-protoporphyrin IX monomethyl ester cyclase
MRVLLVQSWLGGAETPVFPLGLSCLKAALAGHEVRVFDLNTAARPFEELRELVAAFRPEVTGVSLRNIDSTNKRTVVFYYPYLKEAVAAIRAGAPTRIVAGGSGFSMFAREIMADEPGIDLGVLLEGERTFPLLLENLDRPGAVPSVFYRDAGEVRFSGPGAQVDLDAVPLPDRGAVAVGAYTGFPEGIGVETKRGCILDCVYCIYGFLNGKKLRLRSPAKVVDEIEALVGRHGVRRFTFVDSVFNIPQRHAEEVCRELVRRGVRAEWSAWFNEKNLTREFLELAREAGCKNVILSPDGYSDAILERCGKNIRMADIRRAYEALKAVDGLEVSYNFFKNPPGQSFGAFLALAAFFVRAKRELGRRVHFEFNSIRIEPHTRLYATAVAEGFVREGESLLHPKYYTQRSTRLVERLFDALLRLKGK